MKKTNLALAAAVAGLLAGSAMALNPVWVGPTHQNPPPDRTAADRARLKAAADKRARRAARYAGGRL